ncbi:MULTISPECIES: hypothetical protein [Rhizobium]|uniref:hypothetical protein n=1 Tax=Rhizobium TaxID=379 RepID=UPI00234FA05F|nr:MULTISPECIES: hypothetical protein [unclassified Rhizobium]MDC7745205.1 hypothetical protein [Rhizobium sp. BC56]MDC9811124.1 hypothetical protein [Rhizobium sp. MC62]MDC9836501.1 hypothetical protein [Rhizobium sp. MJ37]
MTLDFHWWLKLAVGLVMPKMSAARRPADALLGRDDERDQSAREYELHYWGTVPGLWY